MDKATCQVCGREIKAGTGVIAHHGYQRPYEGWQTSSCAGARYAPYEVSCDRLKEIAEVVEKFISDQEASLSAFLEMPPETITQTERRSAWEKAEEKTYQKPEDFSEKTLRYRSSMPHTYENSYRDRKYQYEQTIKLAKTDLSIMERRLNEWQVAAV